jgi:hypothetical protein
MSEGASRRRGRLAAAGKEIEVYAFIGLRDVVDEKLLVPSLGPVPFRLPSGSARSGS